MTQEQSLITVPTFSLQNSFKGDNPNKKKRQLKALLKYLKEENLCHNMAELKLSNASQILLIPYNMDGEFSPTYHGDNGEYKNCFKTTFNKNFPNYNLPNLTFWQFEADFLNHVKDIKEPLKIISGPHEIGQEQGNIQNILTDFDHSVLKTPRSGDLQHLYTAKVAGTHIYDQSKALKKQGFTTKGIIQSI